VRNIEISRDRNQIAPSIDPGAAVMDVIKRAVAISAGLTKLVIIAWTEKATIAKATTANDSLCKGFRTDKTVELYLTVLWLC